MNGIIALVNVDENSAVLVDENKKQYHFSFDDCIGFDTSPEVGKKVEFDLNGDEIFFVKALKNTEPKKIIDYKIAEKEITTVQKKSNNELHVSIPLDHNVSDCLNNYFEEVISVIYEYEAEFGEDETLDFILIKRFLNTAYNNLRDIDGTFMDEYLLELKGDLKVLESVYRKFHKKNNMPEIAYETIFLEQQLTYQSYKNKMDTNISELYTLKSTVKSLENQIKDIKQDINRCTIAKQIDLKEIDLKKYNRYYVDAIHRSGNLKDENIKLKELLNRFEKKHIDEFVSIYEDEAKKYDQFIREQLNGYAYEFDKKMWESAEVSSAICSFFKRANIDDNFSSKTFLKYFIKGLDETKFSKEHKRLYSLLEYLEDRAKVRILIVSENFKKSDYIKRLIKSLDKEYSVEVIDKPRSSYHRRDLSKLDIIFADISMKNPTIYEFIDMIKKRFIQTNSHAILCVISNSFTKDNLVKLKERNINYLLATNLSNSELQVNIKEMIDSLDG